MGPRAFFRSVRRLSEENSYYSRLLNIRGLFRAVKEIRTSHVETRLYLGLTAWRGPGVPNSFHE